MFTNMTLSYKVKSCHLADAFINRDRLIIVKIPLEQPEIRSPPHPPTHNLFFKCGDFSLWFADGANDNHKNLCAFKIYVITYSLISMWFKPFPYWGPLADCYSLGVFMFTGYLVWFGQCWQNITLKNSHKMIIKMFVINKDSLKWIELYPIYSCILVFLQERNIAESRIM